MLAGASLDLIKAHNAKLLREVQTNRIHGLLRDPKDAVRRSGLRRITGLLRPRRAPRPAA